MAAEVRFYKGRFRIKIDIWDNQRVKQMPQRTWDPTRKIWVAPPTKPNAMYIEREFMDRELSQSAKDEIKNLLVRDQVEPFPADYDFGPNPPMKHQLECLNEAWGREAYGIFFEMRLGKTFTALHLAQCRFLHNQIDQLLVICPTPIKQVWKNEAKKFATVTQQIQVLESGQKLHPWVDKGLRVLVVGVEALSQGGAYQHALSFVKSGRTMGVIDESSRIKNFKSKRTERCVVLGGLCDYRAILTGTPITQGLHDLYSQFEFLDARIIGQKSFYTFRNRYVIMGGFEGRQIMGYRNSKELMELIEPHSMVVKTKDVYDLVEIPPQTRIIKATKEQKDHFASLKHLMMTEHEGEVLEISTILERMTRFQQVNGGFIPIPQPPDKNGKVVWDSKPLKKNPKLDELKEMLDEIGDKQTIIWARFVPEIKAIYQMLMSEQKRAVTFYGATDPEKREYNIKAFQDGTAQFFVANQAVGGMGIKLSNADLMIYYSNTFSYEDKKQSLARWQAMDRTTGCPVIELVLDTVIDKAIMAAQEKKGGMAEYVDTNIKEIKRAIG